jgi:hypothetical protein
MVTVMGMTTLMTTSGCQSEAAAGGAAPGGEVAAAPDAPHPPGSWGTIPGSPHAQWIDTAGVRSAADGVLTIRLLRTSLGAWRLANVEVRCQTLEGRWRAEERWDGAQMTDSAAAPDATDDWIPSVPGGPRRVVFLEACRLAGAPVGPG